MWLSWLSLLSNKDRLSSLGGLILIVSVRSVWISHNPSGPFKGQKCNLTGLALTVLTTLFSMRMSPMVGEAAAEAERLKLVGSMEL